MKKLAFIFSVLYTLTACTANEECEPGTSIECACSNGAKGTQFCVAPGFYEDECTCDSQKCKPDSSETCSCANGTSGTKLCGKDGEWMDCSCQIVLKTHELKYDVAEGYVSPELTVNGGCKDIFDLAARGCSNEQNPTVVCRLPMGNPPLILSFPLPYTLKKLEMKWVDSTMKCISGSSSLQIKINDNDVSFITEAKSECPKEGASWDYTQYVKPSEKNIIQLQSVVSKDLACLHGLQKLIIKYEYFQ